MRSLFFTALLATACLALGLQVRLLALPSSSSMQSAGLARPPGLAVRTIVAYSLEAQLQQAPLPSCASPPQPPSHEPLRNNHIWQVLSGNSSAFLLTAYYDTRVVHREARALPSVRVIAMLYGNANLSLYCQVWFGPDEEPVISRALQTEIWAEQWDAASHEPAYRPFLLSCPVRRPRDTLPRAVSVVEDEPCSPANTLLRLSPPAIHPPKRNSIAVCVKGLDFEEDRSLRLVEWLEATRLLGADKILFYLYRVHANMSRVLTYYEGLGEVQVIRLTLPGRQPNVPSSLRTRFLREHIWQKRRNELVAYNDCLYRNLHFQFILPLDVDEIIVPKQAHTWKKMFNQILQKYPDVLNNYASLAVQNAYFLENFDGSLKLDRSVPEYLHMIRHTERSANFSPNGESVKSFVSTATTLTVFNHYALHALYPAMQTRFLLDTRLVQMNHYQQQCSPLLSADCKTNFQRFHKRDKLLARYRQPLQARVEAVLRNLHLI